MDGKRYRQSADLVSGGAIRLLRSDPATTCLLDSGAERPLPLEKAGATATTANIGVTSSFSTRRTTARRLSAKSSRRPPSRCSGYRRRAFWGSCTPLEAAMCGLDLCVTRTNWKYVADAARTSSLFQASRGVRRQQLFGPRRARGCKECLFAVSLSGERHDVPNWYQSCNSLPRVGYWRSIFNNTLCSPQSTQLP